MTEGEKPTPAEGGLKAEAETSLDPRIAKLLKLLAKDPTMRRHLEGRKPATPDAAEQNLRSIDQTSLDLWTEYQILLTVGYALLQSNNRSDAETQDLLMRIKQWNGAVSRTRQFSSSEAVKQFMNFMSNTCFALLNSVEHGLTTGQEIDEIKQEILDSGHL